MLKENRKSILSAASMVVISAMLLTYTAYAWLTVTKTVEAQGIELKVTTSNDLQISLTGGSSLSEWTDTVSINMKDIVAAQVSGFDKTKDIFYLLPASSFSAFNNQIYTTSRAKTNGQTYDDTIFNIAHTVAKGKEAYEGNYIDIPLYFRTGSDQDSTVYLAKKINSVATTYIASLDDSNIAKTVRIAFLNADGTATSVGGDDTQPLVYANEDHGITSSVINAQFPVLPADKPAPEYMQFNSNPNISDDAVLNLKAADYSGGTISYTVTKMTVRIWIEGQDSNCVVAIGGKSFSVGMGFAVAD